MTNLQEFEILVSRRKQKGFSQTEMARFFGLEGKNAYKEVGKWENGQRPSEKHREKFLEYLTDKLDLKDSPDELFNIWEMLSEKWHWSSLSDEEKQSIIGDDKTESINWENISQDDLLARINSKNPGRSSSAVKAAIELVEKGKLPIQFLLGANKAPYWLIRKLVLEYLVKQKTEDTLGLIGAFKSTSYHVSQGIIREYIRDNFREGKLNTGHLQMAIDILENLSKAPKVTELSITKDLKLKEELQSFLNMTP